MKRIEGFEDYLVTIFGDVYSMKRNMWLKPCNHKDGYLLVNLNKNGKSNTKTIHRLVATAFIPNLNNKPQVNHKDGNKQNNCVDNLEWVTQSENDIHAYKIGLKSQQGIKNSNSKLSENDILLIRDLYLDGLTQRKIATIYEVSQIQISRIVNEKSWGYL